jgi:predicted methyltransferase
MLTEMEFLITELLQQFNQVQEWLDHMEDMEDMEDIDIKHESNKILKIK